MGESRKIAGFKKFSDIKEAKKSDKIEEVELNGRPEVDSDLPANPNLPETADRNSIEKPMSRKGLQPEEQDIDLPSGEENEFLSDEDEKNEKVETFGKVAKFPKNVKASKAYNFLENVKVSKKSIWYIMVEKQDNELQMVKYNNKEGVDLNKFVNELKTYYLNKYSKDVKVCKLIEGIKVDGTDVYSMVKNIPLVTVDGRKMISIITEDLIKLLSK
jgi:hypothetical protein